MGDVKDILGLKKEAPSTGVPTSTLDTSKAPRKATKARKPPNVSREVFALLGSSAEASGAAANLPPMVPSSQRMTGFKDRRDASGGKWEWAPYKNSARKDHHQFLHWQKAGVEYLDYPYARFNIKLDKLDYTDEEYSTHLAAADWTRGDSDHLRDLCQRYDCRWPVIHDRYAHVPERPLEQLQHRYFSMVQKLLKARALRAQAGGVGMGKEVDMAALQADTEAKAQGLGVSTKPYSLEYEEQRRGHLKALFNRTRAHEKEETALKEELKQVEGELKKVRKTLQGRPSKGGKAGAAAASSSASAGAASMTGLTASQAAAADAARLHIGQTSAMQSGVPFRQSCRLEAPMEKPGLSKQLIEKMNMVLSECKVPERPIPTRTVCDLYDQLRRDVVTLLSLQKTASKIEADLQAMRHRPAEVAAQQAATQAAQAARSGQKGGGDSKKRKAPPAASSGGVAAAAAAAAGAGGTAGGPKKKARK